MSDFISPCEVEEPPSDGVTPNLQHSMRSSQTKTLKRGRKAKKGKATKGKKSPKGSKKAKKSLRKKPSTDSMVSGNTGKSKLAKLRKMKSPTKTLSEDPSPHDKPKAMKKKGRNAAPQESGKEDTTQPAAKEELASHSWEPSAWTDVHQRRVKHGRSWRYEVLEGQTAGCSNCRFIWGGCGNCRKSSFRGKSAQQLFKEQQRDLKAGNISFYEAEGNAKGKGRKGKGVKKAMKAKKTKKAKVSKKGEAGK